MKKVVNGVVSLFTAGVLLAGHIMIISPSVYAMEGDGGEETPYRIETCQDLQDINNDLDAFYVLANDIDCSDFDDFQKLGNYDGAFMGELDGQGFSVSNLIIDPVDDFEDYVGLFGQVGESDNQIGLVKDFSLENVTVNGDWSTGGMVGVLYGQLNNVYISGEVNGRGEVGGLVGSHGGVWDTIINSHSAANVTATGDTVGGIAGFNATDSQIINSYATGNVVGADDRVGGLVGVNNGNIENSHATGSVTATDYFVGGLVGDNQGTISRSYATGHVESEGDNVGGLVGYNSGEINRSYSNNTASDDVAFGVRAACNVGGLVGHNSSGIIHNSFSRSMVGNGPLACAIGGFVGITDGTVYQTYSTGVANGSLLAVGGYAGEASGGSIQVSNWDTQTSGVNNACGPQSSFDCTVAYSVTGSSTADMKIQSTFIDNYGEGAWDFENTWTLDSEINDGYPYLLDVGAEPTPQPEEDQTEDLNGDEIDDAEQPNVGGYVSSITGKTVAIDVGEDCELTTDDMVRESQLSAQDDSFEYANGLWDFEAECSSPSTTVSLFYYDVEKEGISVRKFNPNTKQFFTIENASLSERTIDGHLVTVATYNITDGGELDMDGQVDGAIKDPAGVATAVLTASTSLASTGTDVPAFAAMATILILTGSTLTLARRYF